MDARVMIECTSCGGRFVKSVDDRVYEHGRLFLACSRCDKISQVRIDELRLTDSDLSIFGKVFYEVDWGIVGETKDNIYTIVTTLENNQKYYQEEYTMEKGSKWNDDKAKEWRLGYLSGRIAALSNCVGLIRTVFNFKGE